MRKILRLFWFQIFFGFVILLTPIACFGQQVDSILQLNTVEVFEKRWSTFSTGTKSKKLDENILTLPAASLSDALNQSGLFFQKTYGLGSLATSGLRGGAASHTTLLWNGFNINSPFNGLMDFALIPINFFNDVEVNFGGSTDIWGTGAIAGNIHLQNNLVAKEGSITRLGLGVNSFGGFNQNLGLTLGRKNQAFELSFINLTAKNNFQFLNSFNGQKEVLSNSELSNTGVQLNYKNKLNKFLVLQSGFWWQKTKREIPPTFTQANSEAFQEDENFRGYVSLIGNLKGYKLTARTAYFFEDLYFEDAPTNIYSENSSAKSISEIDVSKTIRVSQIHLGINHTYEQGNSGNYSGLVRQVNPSIFGGYKYGSANKKLELLGNFRQARFNETWVPFVYGLGLNGKAFNWLSILANHSKVYRIPNLNDRFWIPGGNQNLLPEEGYANEITFDFHNIKLGEKVMVSNQTTLYSRNISNWIIWLPNGAFWSPQNIQQVWSRGIETNSDIKFNFKDSEITLWLNTNYVLSTNEKSKSPNDASLKKQLIYTPIYQGAGGVSYARKLVKLFWQIQYTGYSYTTSDHSRFLEPFFLSQIGVQSVVNFNNYSIEVSGTLQNIFNSTYQVLANRPMPPRNFQINLNYKFSKS